MKTSFKEGNLSKIYSQIRKTFSKTVQPDVEYSRKVLDFLEQHPSKTKQYRELYEDLHEYVSQHDITQHFANYKHGGLIGLKNIGF